MAACGLTAVIPTSSFPAGQLENPLSLFLGLVHCQCGPSRKGDNGFPSTWYITSGFEAFSGLLWTQRRLATVLTGARGLGRLYFLHLTAGAPGWCREGGEDRKWGEGDYKVLLENF